MSNANEATSEEGGTRVLSPYELDRLAKIARNNARLKQLGLDKLKLKAKNRTVPTNRARTPKPRPRRGSERRSKRLSSSPGVFVMLGDGDRTIEPQPAIVSGDDITRRGRSPSPIPPRRSKKRKVSVELADGSPLTTDQKKVVQSFLPRLKAKGGYLDEFEDYLRPTISEANLSNVMRQIGKLARGEGIRYESAQYGWPEGCYFKKGVVITPLDDIVSLIHEAKDCEDRWGRDHGNGWLTNHPLKKLYDFQQHLLEHGPKKAK